jgi:Fungal specific transcription factor domain
VVIAYRLRRRSGDVTVCAITAGLHRLPDYSDTKITAALEYKRRLFSAVYSLDKIHASLNGTPPGLSKRYCDVRPFLDLEDIFLPQEELALAVQNLGPNGWNKSKEMRQITALRALSLLSPIREDILELSLGVCVTVSAGQIE